jgi:hypothetical protein
MVMKTHLSAGLPVFAATLCTVLLLGLSSPVRAQTAMESAPPIAAAEVPVVETQPIAPTPAVKTESKPAFSGLIPPSGVNTYALEKPSGEDTHPMLSITSDKSELVRLDSDAASIVVGNPDHLGVLMDNRRLLILVPRQPGATYMTVLNSAGEVIMQRHVIVATPKTDYIRIRRSCAGQGDKCKETSVYYCPGMCHPVGIVGEAKGSNVAPLAAGQQSPEQDDTTEPENSDVETEAPTE